MPYVYPFSNTDEPTKLVVWQKGRVIAGHDSTVWRWDALGSVMKYTEHGNTNSKHGWEIDHIKPTSKDGPNIMDNVQPLQWENNRTKGDTWPWP
jgi:5-methylcytosine-specific restriction endonuclease McrA